MLSQRALALSLSLHRWSCAKGCMKCKQAEIEAIQSTFIKMNVRLCQTKYLHKRLIKHFVLSSHQDEVCVSI